MRDRLTSVVACVALALAGVNAATSGFATAAERGFLQWAAGIAAPGTSDGAKVLQGDGTWVDPGGAAAVPAGAILFVISGACPTGYTEEANVSGKTILGTTNGAGNVGTTGGNDNITPAGNNTAPTFTGTPSTCVVNHLHTLATGTGSTGNFSQVIGTVDTSSGGTGGTPTQTALGTLSGNPTAGGAANCTPAGSNSAPSFTGTQFDNRSAFIRLIACKKD